MSRQTLNGVVIPRARRRRVLVTAIAGLSLTATAALAGTMLVNSGGTPMLTVVSDIEPAVVQPSLAKPQAAQPESEIPELASAPADSPQPTADSAEEIRWFNNRPIRPAGTMSMLVTAYSPDEQSCGEWADGITASGYSVWTNGMNLVAADTSVLPLGSLVSIPGYDSGNVVPVLDRGGAIKGNRLDVLYPTHERALQWGVQRLEVTVWEYADGQPNGFRQNHRRR